LKERTKGEYTIMEYTEEKKIVEEYLESESKRKILVKPLNKLILALALTGAVTGSISLIIGSVAVHNDGLNYYLKPSREAV